MQMPEPDSGVIARRAEILQALRGIVPGDSIIAEQEGLRAYECDGLAAYKCPPLCAVLPETTEQVSQVLKICHDENVPVVPRGSGTSLAGGALPTADSVILGIARMNAVLETDFEDFIIIMLPCCTVFKLIFTASIAV